MFSADVARPGSEPYVSSVTAVIGLYVPNICQEHLFARGFTPGYGPQWSNYFNNWTKPIAKTGPYFLFEVPVSGSFYSIQEGEILTEQYKHHEGEVVVKTNTTTMLTQKTNHYATWAATLDGAPVPVQACRTLTCVEVPPGQHTVRFFHRFTAADYLGWLLTIAALSYLIYLYITKK